MDDDKKIVLGMGGLMLAAIIANLLWWGAIIVGVCWIVRYFFFGEAG